MREGELYILYIYIDLGPHRPIALFDFHVKHVKLKILQGHWWWIRGWMWMLGTWKDCLWWIFSAIKLNRSKLWLWRHTSGLLSPDAVYMPLVGCDATWVWFDFESGQHCCFHIPAVLSFLPIRRIPVLDFSLCILAFVQWDCSYSLDSLECENVGSWGHDEGNMLGLVVFLLLLRNIDQAPPGLLFSLIFTWNMLNLKIVQGHWWWIRGLMWRLGTWQNCLWWIFSAIKLNRSKLWLWRNTSGLLSPDAVGAITVTDKRVPTIFHKDLKRCL